MNRLVRHWVTGKTLLVSPLTTTVPTSPSSMMSFHWSKTVTLKVPFGMLLKVTVPSGLHFWKAKSSASAGPTDT